MHERRGSKIEQLKEKEKINSPSENLLFPPEPVTTPKNSIFVILLWIGVAIIVSALCINLFVKPDIRIDKSEITIQPGEDFAPPKSSAEFLGIFDISDKLQIENSVDNTKTGEYSVIYKLHFHGKDYSKTIKAFVVDSVPPVITLLGEEPFVFSSIPLFKEPGVTAFDEVDGDLSDRVTVSFKRVDNTGIALYSVADNSGNKAKAERKFEIKDIVPPDIILVGDEEITISTPEYTEPGVSAYDDFDGDITGNIQTESNFEVGKEGDYKICYTVSDSSGNTSSKERTVHVSDTTSPVLTLSGDDKMYAKYGEGFNDPGVTAYDAFDGDVSASITVDGIPDTYTCGKFTVTYTASDSKGNTSSIQRTVLVYKRSIPVDGKITANGVVSSSTVYLTFDDGPSSRVTPRVLDILKENNVTATFFIIDYSASNKKIIERMINEGHTIGIHGYTHEWSVYSSVDAYMENISKLRQKLIDDFGYETNIIRFLGGSSNTTSKKYSTGIMTLLTQEVVDAGYTYFDWNVSSGDADSNNVPSSKIYSNTVNSLKKNRDNIVLMHDTNAKSTTADALQNVIDYAYENGYTFAGISSDTTPYHHKVSN